MENNERKNNSLTELMEASMSKIRDMVDEMFKQNEDWLPQFKK